MVHVQRRDVEDQDGHADGMSLKCNSRNITSMSDDVFRESLIRIDLSKNDLKSIPSGISVCVNLKWLNLSANAIKDIKPLESLTQLQVLNVSKNALYGKIGVGKFPQLKALVVNGNDIETIGGLEKLSQLETLIVSQNRLSSFGGWIAGATSIQKLSASNNPIDWDGGGNSGLATLTCMKELRLNHTGLDKIPEALTRMKRLRILELGSNNLETFDDVAVLSSMTSIWQLNLKGNPIASLSGYGDRITAMLPQIDVLDTKRLRSKHKRSLCSEEEDKHPLMTPSSSVVAPPVQEPQQKEDDQAIEAEDFLVKGPASVSVSGPSLSNIKETNIKERKKQRKDTMMHSKKSKKTHTSKETLHKVLHAKEDASLSGWAMD